MAEQNKGPSRKKQVEQRHEAEKTAKQASEQKRLSRRKFLQWTAALAGTATVGTTLALLAGKDKTPPAAQTPTAEAMAAIEAVTEETTLEASLKYIEDEIKANPELQNLYAYGDEKTRHFVNHSFNIFKRITNSEMTLAEYVAQTEIGNSPRMETVQRQLGINENPNEVAGRVYHDENRNLKLMFNKDSYVFDKNRILATQAEHPEVRGSVLEFLLDVSLHEPFHLETGMHALNPPYDYPGADDIYSFDSNFGFMLEGHAKKTGMPISIFKGIEELSVYNLQENLLMPKIPFYKHRNPYPRVHMDLAQELFNKGGYNTPEELIALRRSPTAGRDILQRYGPLIPAVPNDGLNPEGRALGVVETISKNLLFEQSKEAEIRPPLDLISSALVTDTVPISPTVGTE